MNKTCLKCKCEKPIELFRWVNSHGRRVRNSRCQGCFNETRRNRRMDDEFRETLNAKRRDSGERETAQKLFTKRRRMLDLLKAERGCYICGGMLPAECLDWDHLPGKDKLFSLGTEGPRLSIETLSEELGKCQVLCSNCHRTLTKQRKCLEDK